MSQRGTYISVFKNKPLGREGGGVGFSKSDIIFWVGSSGSDMIGYG